MMEVGRLCTKTAGRDAGMKCVIVEVLDEKFVMIDGEARRRKCNVKHLEPSTETIKLGKGASHPEVVKEFKNLGIEIKETKPRQAKPKQRQTRSAERKKMAPKEPEKEKAAPKKEQKPKAEKKETKLEKALKEE
ncbi:50S ribosomal protein L14e [Candidatus Woesearchaeota archaeon]|nr:50S ribosomal protein L14e [Candidatus Woesearchaeota archaeon]